MTIRAGGDDSIRPTCRAGDDELDAWAKRVAAWMKSGIREAFVYFDNDALGHAPFDAERLAARLRRYSTAEAGAVSA